MALLAGGMVVGRLTGRPVFRSGLRQLALGALAVAVTYTVGSLIVGQRPLIEVSAPDPGERITLQARDP